MLVTFNARNEHDRCKFAEDLRESISEMDEMDTLRIEAELEKQKSTRGGSRGGNSENRDSGVADVEGGPFQSSTASSPATESNGGVGGSGSGVATHHGGNSGGGEQQHQLKRSALSNSLLDMHEQCE